MQTKVREVKRLPDRGRKAHYMTSQVAEAKKVDVSVVYDADVKPFPYHKHEKVRELLEHAKKAFGVVSNHLLSLFAPDGSELQDDVTLEVADVKPGERLVLGQSVIKGG
jgi:hypothetical protein